MARKRRTVGLGEVRSAGQGEQGIGKGQSAQAKNGIISPEKNGSQPGEGRSRLALKRKVIK
ncbi:hypothetical protein HDU88_008843 [Geranomyces variabilis]|nr:hypothetical protein HDU88_008843 [Geranomyces variabilis]